LFTAKQRPVRGNAGVERAVLARLAQAHAVTQAGTARCRAPKATAMRRVSAQLPLPIGLEIAVTARRAQVEVQAAHGRPFGQGDPHLGLIAFGQQLYVIVERNSLRRPQRARRQQQQQTQGQCVTQRHIRSLLTAPALSRRGKSDDLPSRLPARCLRPACALTVKCVHGAQHPGRRTPGDATAADPCARSPAGNRRSAAAT